MKFEQPNACLNKMNSDDVEIDLSDEVVNNAIGFVLPGDEDDLFADIANDYDLVENDFFGNLGGMELENEVVHGNLSIGMSKMGLSYGPVSHGLVHYVPPSGVGTVAVEHPYGEHPSRTLFVRNINSNVEDSELRSLFEQYGDIETLYTACKHRGFVMISYYDIRDARAAMKGLQNKPLRGKKLDIHYSIPKDNPSEKDINQGTLVVFNLDPSVSNEDLHQIFGQYGEVKEIRETPHKKHHKFIEYFDVRSAEAALRALNRSDIAGKSIKLEPSRPGGTRRNLMFQLNQELEHDESRFRHHVGSSTTNLPPGNWLPFNPGEHNSTHTFSQTLGFRTTSPSAGNHQPGLASLLHPRASTSPMLGPIGKDLRKGTHLELNLGGENSGTIPSIGSSSSSNGSTIETLSGPQFLWGGPTTYSDNSKTSAWLKPTHSVGYQHGYPYSSRHHVLERQFGFFPESLDASFIGRSGLRGVNVGPTNSNPPSFRMMSSTPRLSPVVINNGPYRRDKRSANRVDNKKQFCLELEKIASGEDTRTTLMIKNIPNKYTSKMLLATIDENHKGIYDFFYLPIDFKNKCNVGYAFINMLSPSHIIPFYEAFNGKKWEKFNSEKVALLAYARIQGRNALVAHFQNSSVMNEDKCRRPILFNKENSGIADQIIQEHLPSAMNLQICQSNGSDPTQSFETSQKDDS